MKKSYTEYWFLPKEDITAYELSLIMGKVVFSNITSLESMPIRIEDNNPKWVALPEGAKRHFIKVERKQ